MIRPASIKSLKEDFVSEFENIRDDYLNGATKLHQISREIIIQRSTKITKKKIHEYKEKLALSYCELLEIDCKFSKVLRIKGGYSDNHPDTSDEEFISINRSFFISNLEKLEKEIMNIENAKQFRLTINIAIYATLISAIGILLSVAIK